GGALGMGVATWLVSFLDRFRPPEVNAQIATSLDLRVLLFALGASVTTGILCGLAPAWRTSRPQVVPELKGSGNTAETRLGRWNLRGALVVLQFALTLPVLVSAGLCVKSLNKLQSLDPGFEPSRVV